MRPHDTLARLGGDEFAALIPKVRSRAEVEEVAQRLDACFGEPFEIELSTLIGTASLGIALYPQDGATRDSLLDAAGFHVRCQKHQKENNFQFRPPCKRREKCCELISTLWRTEQINGQKNLTLTK